MVKLYPESPSSIIEDITRLSELNTQLMQQYKLSVIHISQLGILSVCKSGKIYWTGGQHVLHIFQSDCCAIRYVYVCGRLPCAVDAAVLFGSLYAQGRPSRQTDRQTAACPDSVRSC